MDVPQQIERFLAGAPHAVVGASSDRSKYGNKVLRAFLQHDRAVYPVNPQGGTIEGMQAYASLAQLPDKPYGVSIITPPAVTQRIAIEIIDLGIQHVWMQPGAESESAITQLVDHGVQVLANGPCILVALQFREQ